MGTVENTGNDCAAYERGEQSERGVEYWQRLSLPHDDIKQSFFKDKWVGDVVEVPRHTADGAVFQTRRWTVRGRHFHMDRGSAVTHLAISTFDPSYFVLNELTYDEVSGSKTKKMPNNPNGVYPRCRPRVGDRLQRCERCGKALGERDYKLPCSAVPPEQRWGEDVPAPAPAPAPPSPPPAVVTVEDARWLKTLLEHEVRNLLQEYERRTGVMVTAAKVYRGVSVGASGDFQQGGTKVVIEVGL